MDQNQIMQIFEDTAYVRMGGSAEELRAAEYLKAKCAEFIYVSHLPCTVKFQHKPYSIVIMLWEQLRKKRHYKILSAYCISAALPCEMYDKRKY